MLKNSASRRDPAVCGFCKCSHAIGWKPGCGFLIFLSLEPQAYIRLG
jgi:hypothetical protein